MRQFGDLPHPNIDLLAKLSRWFLEKNIPDPLPYEIFSRITGRRNFPSTLEYFIEFRKGLGTMARQTRTNEWKQEVYGSFRDTIN